MQLLALETSRRTGSIAAFNTTGETIERLAEESLPTGVRTAQALAPALRTLLHQLGWSAGSIDLVCVGVGPGSFTGLRIGVTTAKVFAYATGAKLIGVNTLDALASQVPVSEGKLWVVMDAQRQELFAARYALGKDNAWQQNLATHLVAVEPWLVQLQAGDLITGPDLTRLASRLPGGVQVVDSRYWLPTATAVGRVAWRRFQAGQHDNIWQLVPQYYRLSAAEEKLGRSPCG